MGMHRARPAFVRGSRTATLTIASGASVSDAVDTGGYALLALETPAAWTAAALTFQHSRDGSTSWTDLYDDQGTEVSIPSAALSTTASRTIVDNTILNRLAPLRYLRVRSGTAAIPVAQAAQRQFVLSMEM